MRRSTVRSGIAILSSLLLAGAIAWAGSQGGVEAFGVPLFAVCGGLAFAINWLAFVPAYRAQTERYYDLVGSLSFLALAACGVALGRPDARAWLLAGLVAVWAVRLGSFLFTRILRDGSDPRFDRIKPDLARFLTTWTLQGLWVFVTLSCALAAITSARSAPLGLPAAAGTAAWLAGLAIEAAADQQKRAFRADPANRERFITTGLWAWSQHPNYFGEILLWAGIALVALPALAGWQLVTLVSPAFVFVLLTRISGIPLLEARARRRWGDDPGYRAYSGRTPVLWPRPPASA